MQSPLELHFSHHQSHQLLSFDLDPGREPRHQRHADALLNQALDRFDRWHLHRNVQRRAMLFESANNFLAVGRRNVVSDERFSAEFPYGHDLVRRERMVRRHDQSYFVGYERQRLNRRIAGLESDDADLYAAANDFARDAAGQGAPHFNLDVWMARA